MKAGSVSRKASQLWHDIPAWQKWAFAVASVLVLIGALAAQVQNERLNYSHKDPVGPPVRVVDLDFMSTGEGRGANAFYSLSPLGQIDLGRSPGNGFITYRSGHSFATFTPAGSTYSGLDWWRGGVGNYPPTTDGVHARYDYLFPATAADVVAGIDGVEFTLELRSRQFVGIGDLSYDFWLETSDGLYPAGARGPLLAGSTTRATVSGAIPIKDGAGRTVFVITPATATVVFDATPRPASDRSSSLIEFFPAHAQGDRSTLPLDYAVERVGKRIKLSVLVPVERFSDPSIAWPIRIDPGITNPIANSSYFADETIIMDSDLVVTSSGAAQFSNVTLLMNRTAAPNYNISVESGGRVTLLNSRVMSNDSALPYKFTVNGTFTAQDTTVQHTNDGVQLRGDSATLSNVTLMNGTGRGLVVVGGNASMARVDILNASTVGLYAQRADLQAQFVNVTGAGGDGIYLNATGGNLSWTHVINATANGAFVVNASGINITHSEFAHSGRNGILAIGGAPSVENSSVTSNNWSGVVLFGDHSAYFYGNLIAANNRSGVEARLNSTADLYANQVEDNAVSGIRVVAADPNIQRNTVRGSPIGVWLEGAHNPGGKPGPDGNTESGYSYLLAADAEIADGGRVPLVAGVSISHNGAATQGAVPAATVQFPLTVTNTDTTGPTRTFTLSIDDDQPAWASLSVSSVNLGAQQSTVVTLTVTVPSGATKGSSYDVKIWANQTTSPFPKASVWAYIDLQWATTVVVSSVATGNHTTIGLAAVLSAVGSGPLSGKTIAFKLDGHWVGEATTDSGGVAVLSQTVSQPPTSQALLAYFNGTQYYHASSGSGTVTIAWKASYLEAPNASGRWGDPSNLSVRLLTTPGDNPAVGRTIYFSLDGSFLGTGLTDWQGYATYVFADAVEPGTVSWNASFDEDPYTGLSSNTSNFTSYKDLTVLTATSFTIRQGETANHATVLTDDEGNALASRTVHVKRGSTTLADITTDSNGAATYADTGAQSLAEGDYSMTYVTSDEDHFYGTTAYFTLTVRKWVSSFNVTNQTEHYGDATDFVAQLRDEALGPLASKSVKVYIAGALADTVTTDGSGWATYHDDAMRVPGTYELKFVFDADTRNAAVTAAVNLTVMQEITRIAVTSDARIVLGAVLAIILRLTDDEGNALSRPINVTLRGGVYANGTSDSSGYLTVNFDSRGILAERYVLWYFFGGEQNYSGSEAYTRIVVEYDADMAQNVIEGNGVGISANNSSTRIMGDRLSDNGENLVARNGSILIYNGTVGLSQTADFRLGQGGSVYATNTTFNREKVTFDSGGVLLLVRWLLDFQLLDPATRAGVSGTTVLVYDLSGVLVLNQTTNATGWFGLAALTEYAQNSTSRAQATSHRLNFSTGERLFVLMDVSHNMTLFRGADADLDGIGNALEVADDLFWVELETHALEYPQIIEDRSASGGRAVAALAGDGRFTDAYSFPTYASGNYTVEIRARAELTNGTLRVVVKAANGTLLANQTFTPSGMYRWFELAPFLLSSEQELRINITDESASPALAQIRVDELAVARLSLPNGTRTHYEGQLTNWLQGDTDLDGGFDGAELRNGSYWLEAEYLASGDALRVSKWDSSSSWVVKHANGTDVISVLNQTRAATPGVYALRPFGVGPVRVDLYYNGSYNRSANFTLAAGGLYHPVFRFEYALGTTFEVRLCDGADNGSSPVTYLDKVSLALEEPRLGTPGLAVYANGSSAPRTGTSPIYVGREYDPNGTPLLYWVSGDMFYAAPAALAIGNATMNPTWAYQVGANPTQPFAFHLQDGTPMIGLTAGGKLQVFPIPILPATTPTTYTFPGGQTPNAAAYADGWIVASTREGTAYGVMVTAAGLLPLWTNTPGLGVGLGAASIFHDKAYFGFEKGLLAVAYNITKPAAEAWRVGINGWWDPRDHCPSGVGWGCYPPGTFALANRSVAGSFLFDTGQVFVVAYNSTETDLYRLTEDGDIVWAVNLNFSIWQTQPALNLNLTAPRLAMKNNTLFVLGTSLKAFDRDNGTVLWGHELGSVVQDHDFTGGLLATDREVVAPTGYGLAFFADPGPALFGDALPFDGNHTFGGLDAEDTLWEAYVGSVEAQPLLGDFDGSGYRDLLFTTSAGFRFIKDFEVGQRNYLEFPQLGRDATHNGNAEYLLPFLPTDPLDPDLDFDNATDGAEVGGWAGFRVVQAEDASEYQAWSDSPTDGQAKNYGMFHETGVTLEADEGNVSYGGSSISWIRFTFVTPITGTYRLHLVGNTSVASVDDLRFQKGDAVSPESADPSQGYGSGASLQGRDLDPQPVDALLTPAQTERLRQMVENATYLSVRYQSMYVTGPPAGMTSFGAKHDTEITIKSVTYNPRDKGRLRATVFLSMDIDFDLFGSLDPTLVRQYEFELGLNLSLIPVGGMGGDPLPATLEYLRILDLDSMRISKQGLDPYSTDVDGDGILDGDELAGTPWAADTDFDGLTDPEEIYTYHTDPTDRDTDHDGIRDRVELGFGGDSTGWASVPEWVASKFRGDPLFKVPSTGRVLPNFDADTNTTTDPLNPDTDGDGIPDGWMDGWMFDPSWMAGQIRHKTATTEYLSRAAPVDYNLSYWHATGVFDSYAQIWEGEDANLNGATDGGNWSFWVSLTSPGTAAANSTALSFVRKGPGETDPSKEDTDGDGVPEGYEVWYATRDPVWKDGNDSDILPDEDLYFFSPVANDSGVDVDRATGHLPVDAGVATPNANFVVTVAKGSANFGKGIFLPPGSNGAIQAEIIQLDLSAAVNGSKVDLELWQNTGTTFNNPDNKIASATGIVLDTVGWVDFDIDPTWLNFSSDSYLVALRNASSDVTWWGSSCSAQQKVYTLATDGTGWTSADLTYSGTKFNLSARVVDYFSITGDGLTNKQEYQLGTNPKLRDTDAGTGGPLSNMGDMLNDSQEMKDHTIYRTNAFLGGLVSTYYGTGTWALFDPDVLHGDSSQWMYFEYLETLKDPAEGFPGAKNASVYMFALDDGAELQYNATAQRMYFYLPGANIQDLVEEQNLSNVSRHYNGTVLVYYQASNSIPPSAYLTNAIIPVANDPFLFRYKQFYASDPFDWDTDNDGLADGWETDPFADSDGDMVPNVRDTDSDNDGLTDGQEMLQVQSDWTGETGTTAANLKFDPEGDALYPMVDTDSDGDGIPDAKEVLWSVDTDRDGRINLVDPDSDGDGLCDGWCTASIVSALRFDAPPGVASPDSIANGEDANQNGTNEQGESSPVKVDTDGDGLYDGYAYIGGAWKFSAGIDGNTCPSMLSTSEWCGEDTTYWLRNGTASTSYTARTNRTNQDSDADGLTDRQEVISRWANVTLVDGTIAANRTVSDPWKGDTDGDLVKDLQEWTLATNATSNDTDADGVMDGYEDLNRDGHKGTAEWSATMQDTDGDGLKDGQEDVNANGVNDANEPSPLLKDTDADGINDKNELDLMHANDSSWTVSHDFDSDGVIDLKDKDSDNDGLNDNEEDINLDGAYDATETNAYDLDSDDDALLDRAEPNRNLDAGDADTAVNARDVDSNGDATNDNSQVWVDFRTNATSGNYASSSVWIALDPSMDLGQATPSIDFSAAHALYLYDSTVASPAGTQVQIQYYKGMSGGQPVYDLVGLATPEGYKVFRDTSDTSHVYVQISAALTVKFVKSSTAPSDYATEAHPVQAFTVARQEMYDGRRALDEDTDHDGLANTVEGGLCGTSATDSDSDDDGIPDGAERGWCTDTDSDGKKNAMDKDSDNDGIGDGVEDANLDGIVSAGETDALVPDTDGDGIQDGTELGYTFTTDTADTCEASGDSGCGSAWLFVADADSATHTSALDRDTDNDGIDDGAEDVNYNGKRDATSGVYTELDPLSTDSDSDGLTDGQERGLATAGRDTDISVFKADLDPTTTTDPLQADSDGDGLPDGREDLDHNGRVDSGEANPNLWDTDGDSVPDGWVDFGAACTAPCENVPLGGSWGEDPNLNGVRDKDATTGDWSETDFLASDSDVDGLGDGAEEWGRWCYKTESSSACNGVTNRSVRQLWTVSPAKNGALTADFDGDGLRDGQETAGWMVGIWYERTMEKVRNYTVASSPLLADTDSDTLTDFSEFMNGSDPGVSDTDGDGITDPQEIERKSNITGIEGTPPQISNVKLEVGIDWDWWGILWLPLRSHVTVSFDVSDNVGLDTVTVKFIRYTGTETRQLQFSNNPGSYTTSAHVNMKFDFSIFEALVAGADVNITAFDVNGNGAWGDFHIKSVLEAVVDAIAAFLSAIAKVIVEAASAAINWIIGWVSSALRALADPLISAFRSLGLQFSKALTEPLEAAGTRGASLAEIIANLLWYLILGSVIWVGAIALLAVFLVIEKITYPFTATLVNVLGPLFTQASQILIILFMGVALFTTPESDPATAVIDEGQSATVNLYFLVIEVIVVLGLVVSVAMRGLSSLSKILPLSVIFATIGVLMLVVANYVPDDNPNVQLLLDGAGFFFEVFKEAKLKMPPSILKFYPLLYLYDSLAGFIGIAFAFMEWQIDSAAAARRNQS